MRRGRQIFNVKKRFAPVAFPSATLSDLPADSMAHLWPRGAVLSGASHRHPKPLSTLRHLRHQSRRPKFKELKPFMSWIS